MELVQNLQGFGLQVKCLAQQKVEDAHLAIAHRLGLHYLILQSPAMHNIRYSAALRV